MGIILEEAAIGSHTNLGNGWTNQFMRALSFFFVFFFFFFFELV